MWLKDVVFLILIIKTNKVNKITEEYHADTFEEYKDTPIYFLNSTCKI